MTNCDAREWAGPAGLEADICIVGAGAAGITLASQLQATGRDICLLESGGLAPDAATQGLYDLESVGYPPRPDYMSRARYFGGSCNLWAGRCMPLQPVDFAPRDWVPHSGWPIGYDEVAHHYPAASRILGLPDSDPAAATAILRRMSMQEQRLFGEGPLAPTLSWWARRPMRFGAAWRRRLQGAGNVRVVLNGSVTELHPAPSGDHLQSVTVTTLAGTRLPVRARWFVLACGGLENARLLLVSRERHPRGIGNDRDLVGRFFMEHPRAVLGRIHVPAGTTLPLLRGRPLADGKLQLGIGTTAATQRRDRLLNHYVTLEELSSGYAEASYQSAVQTMKVVLRRGHAGSRLDLARARIRDLPDMIYLLSPKELMPHPLYRAWVALRDHLPAQRRARTFVAVYFCEQPPDPASRVTLAGGSDALGVPRLRLDWQLGSAVTNDVLRLQQLLAGQVARSGFGRLEPGGPELHYTDASHHMGTTRMSASPADGVVDTDCRVHGIDNLFIAGSSVFPCAGHANPTLTIVALALRLGERLRTLPAAGRS